MDVYRQEGLTEGAAAQAFDEREVLQLWLPLDGLHFVAHFLQRSAVDRQEHVARRYLAQSDLRLCHHCRHPFLLLLQNRHLSELVGLVHHLDDAIVFDHLHLSRPNQLDVLADFIFTEYIFAFTERDVFACLLNQFELVIRHVFEEVGIAQEAFERFVDSVLVGSDLDVDEGL